MKKTDVYIGGIESKWKLRNMRWGEGRGYKYVQKVD